MSKKQKLTEVQESIVRSIVSVPDHTHPLEALFEDTTLTSIGIVNLGGGDQWVSYVMKTKGKHVLSVEAAEPNLKAIAEESAKIEFVNNFTDQEVI